MRPVQRIESLVSRPWLVWLLVAALTLVLYWRALWVGFMGEDFMFLQGLEHPGRFLLGRGFWGQPLDRLPGFSSLWWTEPGAKGSLYRPLSTLVIAAIHRAAGSTPVAYHAVSLALHAAVSFLVVRLALRLTRLPRLSLLAGLVFLVSEDHVMPVMWVAHMTDPLAAVFVGLGLVWHHRALEQKSLFWGVLAFVSLVCAILSKETGLVGLGGAALLTFLSVVREGTLGERIRALGSASAGWLPHLVGIMAFLVAYKVAGFGSSNLAYHDPFGAPGLYFTHLLESLPLGLGGLLSPVPIGLALFMPGLLWPFLGLSWIVIGVVGVLLWPDRRRGWVLFAVLFMLGALLPQLATDVSQRMFYLPMMTGALLVARLIAFMPRLRFLLGEHEASPYPRLGSVVGTVTLVTLVVMPPLMTPAMIPRYAVMLSEARTAVTQTIEVLGPADPEHVVYLSGPGELFAPYPRDTYEFMTGRTRDVRVLSSYYGPTWLRIGSPTELSLKTEGKRWLTNLFARVTRRSAHVRVGQEFPTPLFTARIERTTPDHEDALEVSFTFHVPLSSPELALLYWDGKRVERLTAGSAVFKRASSGWVELGVARVGLF
jgi:hypothetical protein